MTRYDQVYLDKLVVNESLQGYASPKSKITRMLNSGELLHIRRGLYLAGENSTFSVKTLANIIYGPSYISFEYALAYHGFIPERTYNITSAVFGKNKNKHFETPVGTFIYRHIPEAVYFLDYRHKEENGHPYLIATAEKAICDTLYQYRQIKSLHSIGELVYEDLRIDKDKIASLDLDIITALAPGYGKKVTNLFVTWLKKVKEDA